MTEPFDPNLPGAYPPSLSPAAPHGLSSRLGPRALRRPEARFGVSLGGAAAALVILGVAVWSIGYLAAGLHLRFDSETGLSSTSGEGRRFLGVVLSLALVVVGYALVLARRTGPLATTGAVAGAFGVPLLMTFLTLNIGDMLHGQLPISVDAVYLVSLLVWLAGYFLVPGMAGRAFLLAIALTDIATYIAFKAEGDNIFAKAATSASNGSLPSGGNGTGTLAAIGLIFGLGYYAIAALLDRHGRAGVAIAFVYAGFLLTVTGVIAAIPSFHQVGTGILLLVLGAVLCGYAGWFGRRFTAWVWAFGFLAGVVVLVAKAAPHSYTAAGIALIVIGAIVALLAQLVSDAGNEPPEFLPEPARPMPGYPPVAR